MEVITSIILLDFIPPRQDICHWLKYLGVHISAADFDVDDGISISVP